MDPHDIGSMTLVSVGELMNRKVITVREDASVHDAIRLMIQHSIRHLPVVDEDGKVVALISDRNVRMMVTPGIGAEERRRILITTPVMDRASKPVTTISSVEFAHRAAKVFIEQRIGCLPVVDNDDLVGIITQTDLLHMLSGDLD